MSFIVDIISSNLLSSLLPKALVSKDGQVSTPVLVAASALPFLASLIWKYSHTVVEVTDHEQLRWMQHWLAKRQDHIRYVRKITLISAGSMIGSRKPRGCYRYDEPNEEREVGDRFSPPKLIETLASGITTWLWYGWIPISIKYNQSSYNYEEENGTSGCNVTVWFTPHRADVAKNILLEGRQLWLSKRATKTEILTLHEGLARYGEIDFQVVKRPSRPLSSVIIEGTIKDELLEDMTRFLGAEKWYICKGIPYRRGYLLYGPAGCGKTSLITSLAGHLRLPVVVVPLGGSIDDNTLRDALRVAPRDSIILFEDIDCALRAGNRSDKEVAPNSDDNDDGPKHITLSGLLNAIDGVAAQEGRIIFMTTNYINRLDDALIRPGRIDMTFQLRKASKVAAGELFDQFFVHDEFPNEYAEVTLRKARSDFLDEIEDGVHSFAKLQGVLMIARDDPNCAAEELRKAVIALDDAEEDHDVSKVDNEKGEKQDTTLGDAEEDHDVSKVDNEKGEKQDTMEEPTEKPTEEPSPFPCEEN